MGSMTALENGPLTATYGETSDTGWFRSTTWKVLPVSFSFPTGPRKKWPTTSEPADSPVSCGSRR